MPLELDWAALQAAFEESLGDGRHFLDRETGAVLWLGDEDPDPGQRERIVAAPDRFAAIEPLDGPGLLGWMRGFTATVLDSALRARLTLALDGLGPLRHFRLALRDEPEADARWRAYRAARLRERILAWLTEHGVQPAEDRMEPAEDFAKGAES